MTEATEPALVDGATSVPACSPTEATKRAKEAGQRVRRVSSDDQGNFIATNRGTTTESGL
jgi:hypothetical protein